MTLTNIVSASTLGYAWKTSVSVVSAASEYLMGSLLRRNVSTLASYGHALKAVTVLPGSALIPRRGTQSDLNNPLCLMFFNSFILRFRRFKARGWGGFKRFLCWCCFHSAWRDNLVFLSFIVFCNVRGGMIGASSDSVSFFYGGL